MALVKCFERYYKKKKQTTTHQFNCSIAYGINDGLFSIFYRLREACSDLDFSLFPGVWQPDVFALGRCLSVLGSVCWGLHTWSLQSLTELHLPAQSSETLQKVSTKRTELWLFCWCERVDRKIQNLWRSETGKTWLGLVRTGIEMENNPWQ